MQIFKTRENGFKEVKKRILVQRAPVLLTAAIAAIVINYITSKGTSTDFIIFLVGYTLIIVAIGIGIYRGLKKQEAVFNSYTFIISNNLIAREQLNTPTISIYLNEIKEIVKHKNGSFTIRGKRSQDLIYIPLQIDNYAELESCLQNIKPIVTKASASFLEKYQGLVVFPIFALMVCIYVIKNRAVVTLAGMTLAALMIWSFIQIRNNLNLDKRIKRMSWWILVVLAAVIIDILFNFFGTKNMS